ncbi:MAG: 4-alpha-glucanotransferase [Candidatus Binatia bacterium]|nr:MAG: 4-alpha-glucanotransferase [Candidatus Binatia bacterium]
MPGRPWLRRAAGLYGIVDSYLDGTGRRRVVPYGTLVSLLAALGVDASTESSARLACEGEKAKRAARLLEPVRVVTVEPTGPRSVASDGMLRWAFRPGERDGSLEWRAELSEEAGPCHAREGRAPRGHPWTVTFPRPRGLGYHTFRIRLGSGDGEVEATQRVVVAPARCWDGGPGRERRGLFGLCVNLYALRSQRNWGVGDLGDVRRLLAWCRRVGSSFVGLNPLHAIRNEGTDTSPYSPSSRLFRNWLYLDVGRVPELRHLPALRKRISASDLGRTLEVLRRGESVPYERVRDLKRRTLLLLYEAFLRGVAGEKRRAEFETYCEREGAELEDFAVFCALEDVLRARFGGWPGWPPEYRALRSRRVEEFRRERGREVGFYRFLQFETDRQLAELAREASRLGLPVGLYQDLALGSSADGFDTWARPELFVAGVEVGAPPDAYSRSGQNWGFPPVDPRKLRETGYEFWIRLLRTASAHAGAVRIDHVLGLFRQFWIPSGRPAREGTYVRFPFEELVSVLALESHRARALVIGEDLGTVPKGFSRRTRNRGILSCRVLYFERTRGGTFRPARSYPSEALATANTHDLPPVEGFLRGRDLELRYEAGAIPSRAALSKALASRRKEVAALRKRLSADGLLPESAPAGGVAFLRAVHAFLGRSPSRLVGISYDDLTGETDPVNLPGVSPDVYPSWRRKNRRNLEDVVRDPAVRTCLEGLEHRRFRAPRRNRSRRR